MTTRKIKGGIFIIVKGHPPAGDKPEIVGFGFKQSSIERLASKHAPCYIYQLKAFVSK